MRGFITSNRFIGLSVMAGTIKEVASMAGVSTATVSRVANGGSNVSRETRTRVLSAISTLQYCPNAAAVELRRATGDFPRKGSGHLHALANKRAKPLSSPGADLQKARRKRGHLCCLEDECTRVSRVIAQLSKDLEKLRSMIR